MWKSFEHIVVLFLICQRSLPFSSKSLLIHLHRVPTKLNISSQFSVFNCEFSPISQLIKKHVIGYLSSLYSWTHPISRSDCKMIPSTSSMSSVIGRFFIGFKNPNRQLGVRLYEKTYLSEKHLNLCPFHVLSRSSSCDYKANRSGFIFSLTVSFRDLTFVWCALQEISQNVRC